MATRVTLRQKKISKGRKSLYLDFYPPVPHPKTGEPTRREFINMYLFSDKKELKKGIDDLNEKIKKRENQNKDCKTQYKELKELKEFYKSFKGLTPIDKQHNTETLKIAESIRQKRQNFLDKPEIYNEYEKEQLRIKELSEQSFIEYFKKLTDKRKVSNHDNWISAYNYLESFTNGKLKFADLNEGFLEDFKEYLLTTKSNRSNKTTLSVNSAVW
ncbi:MAG: phage integrase SAM-like domain-containing protein [Bacteroidales bacterium]